jgi:hypothetical protein
MERKTGYNNGFVQWLGLGFSFGKTSMIRNFVLYLLWSVLNHKPLKQSRKTSGCEKTDR